MVPRFYDPLDYTSLSNVLASELTLHPGRGRETDAKTRSTFDEISKMATAAIHDRAVTLCRGVDGSAELR